MELEFIPNRNILLHFLSEIEMDKCPFWPSSKELLITLHES